MKYHINPNSLSKLQEKFFNKIFEETAKINSNSFKDTLQNLVFPINNNNLINNANNYFFNENFSTHKRNRERDLNENNIYSPLKSAYLNPFTPILTRESPSIQRYFNLIIEDKNFTPTPNNSFALNKFIFNPHNSHKTIRTPQDMKNKENY